jgi:hypothetical protein
MILADKKLIPNEILKDSVLVHLADAYFHITRRMEQRKRTASEGSPYKGKSKGDRSGRGWGSAGK